MPIFDYVCESCENTEEKIVKTLDDVVECRCCGSTMKRKDFTGTGGFQLKGTGWYETDFKDK